MGFYGAELKPGQTHWIDASPDIHVQLTNACLFKRPKKKEARIVLEVSPDETEVTEEPVRVAIAVLTPKSENVTLDVMITSRMGLRLTGPDAAGAVVHVVGNELEPMSDDDEEIEIPPGLMDLNQLLGECHGENDDSSDDGDDDEDEDEDDDENEELPDILPDKNSKGKNLQNKQGEGKLVVKKKTSQLPLINHKSGLKMQDILVGSGKKVVKGHNVALQYTLRLENGKVVDKADRKRPFKFRLGVGECVKGFDIGVMGMREGGERHLIVPPNLGYGSQSPPGIPPNATLYFDIKVIKAF